MSASLVAMDDLISQVVEDDPDGNNLDLAQKLARIAKQIKNEMRTMRTTASEAEACLKVSKIADEKSSLDLASSREKLREAADELDDMKEEMQELRLRNIALEAQLQQSHEEKRALEGDATDQTAKRQKTSSSDMDI